MLIGFDFDLTLSCARVYGRRDFHQLRTRLFGGEERIHLLQEFFQFLSSQEQHQIIIISWNFKEIIAEALQAVGLFSSVHYIFDRNDMIQHGGYMTGKQHIIEWLATKWKLDVPQDVVFVDDDPLVLERITTCATTVLVKDAKGITLDEMKRVAEAMHVTFEPKSAPQEAIA